MVPNDRSEVIVFDTEMEPFYLLENGEIAKWKEEAPE
jgi:hypothetical protein